MITLPRQARVKHRESTQQKGRVLAAGYPTFSDNQHLYPRCVEEFASFLDATVGMAAQDPPKHGDYCV